MDRVLFKNKWVELSDKWGFSYNFSKYGYHDERPMVSFYVTSAIALLILAPLGFTYQAPWWYWIATGMLFLFGRFQLFISIPYRTGKVQFEGPEWGVYYHDKQLWFRIGREVYSFSMPYDLVHVRHSILLKDGTWEHSTKEDKKSFWEDHWEEKKWKQTYPYSYELKSGYTQQTLCDITVEEREWRWKLFRWLPWGPFKKVERSIDISFQDPIGERVNTWKGGVYGTGYKMKAGETPWQTLRRMEQERKFT